MDVCFISFILVLLVKVHITQTDSDFVDPLGWDYDRETKGSKPKLSSPNSRRTEDGYDAFQHENELLKYPPASETSGTTKEHSQNRNQNDYYNKPRQRSTTSDTDSKDFIRRFINLLLRASGLNRKGMVGDESSTADIDLTVTAAQMETLERFGKSDSDVSLQEVDFILSNIIRSKNFNIPREYFGWMDSISLILHSKETWFKLLMVGFPALLVWMVLLGHKLARIVTVSLVIIFSSSYVITYYRLYKGIEIQQMQILQQHQEIPIECRPLEMSWWQALIHSLTSLYEFDRKKCQEYHEAFHIDPMLEVWPTRVLSEMMADFFLAPAGRLGTAIASFTSGIMRDVPPMYAWFVYIFASTGIFMLLVLGLVMLCGGRVRIGGFLMGLEMSSGQTPSQITAGGRESLPNANSVTGGDSNHPFIDTIKNSNKGLVLMDIHSVRELCTTTTTTTTTTPLMQHRDAVETIQSSDFGIKGDKPSISTSPEGSKGNISCTSEELYRSNYKPESSMSARNTLPPSVKSDIPNNSSLFVESSSISLEKPNRKDSSTMTEAEETLSCEIEELRSSTMSPMELCSHGINICRQIRNNSKPNILKALVERPINSPEIKEIPIQSNKVETEEMEQETFHTCETQDEFGIRLRNISALRSVDGSGDAT